jgi:hypothetical protein
MVYSFPTTVYAGDSVSFETIPPLGKNPEEWSLSWAIRGADSLDAVGTVAESGNWETTLDGAATADLSPGSYGVWGYVMEIATGKRETVYSGVVRVEANPVELAEYDPRSEAEKILDTITAVIKTRVSGGISTYTIEGRSASYYSLEELLKLRDRYVAIVEKEKQARAVAQGLPNPNRLRVRFY